MHRRLSCADISEGTAVANAKDSQPLFIDKVSKNFAKWSSTPLDEKAVLGLDKDVDPHFWFDAMPTSLEKNS